MKVLHRYLLSHFITSFFICLFAFTSLFLVFELFERMNVFFREGANFFQVVSYLFFNVPLTIHLMTPIALLISTLITVGQLSILSEITAMRACGVSLFWLARPLLAVGFTVSLLMLAAGETIVPWATQRVEDIYHIDIKKKVEKGRFSRDSFWYRSKNRLFSIGYYDSRLHTLEGVSIFEFGDNFQLKRRINAKQAIWMGPSVGWSMESVVELTFDPAGKTAVTQYKKNLPLVIPEKPGDFYNRHLKPESMSYIQLKAYIEKLRSEGAVVTRNLVDLRAKIAFPFVSFIVILVAFPFALVSARSGNMTKSFVWGVSAGFGYYVVHALSISLGTAELIPVTLSAWTANILLGSFGGYLFVGAEH